MARKTERCDRCEETYTELFPTTMGWLCEDCAWAVSERDGEGEVFAELAGLYGTRGLEQHGRDRQAEQ